MKRIKYRLWSEYEKRYLPIWDYAIKGDGYIIDFLNGVNNTCQDEVVEQYTGLEDENGKEIYEGDIIRAQYYDGAQANNRCPAKVVWSDFYLCFVARFKDARKEDGNTYLPEEMPINAGNMEGVKVIGNIHENPELMEEE